MNNMHYGPKLPYIDIRNKSQDAALTIDSAGVMFYSPGKETNIFLTWDEMEELMTWRKFNGERNELVLNSTFSVIIDGYYSYKMPVQEKFASSRYFLPKVDE